MAFGTISGALSTPSGDRLVWQAYDAYRQSDPATDGRYVAFVTHP